MVKQFTTVGIIAALAMIHGASVTSAQEVAPAGATDVLITGVVKETCDADAAPSLAPQSLPPLREGKLSDEDYHLEDWSETQCKELIQFVADGHFLWWEMKQKGRTLTQAEQQAFELYEEICSFGVRKGDSILRRKYSDGILTVDDIPYLRLYKRCYLCRGSGHPVPLPYQLDGRKHKRLQIGDWAADFSLPKLGDEATNGPRCVPRTQE